MAPHVPTREGEKLMDVSNDGLTVNSDDFAAMDDSALISWRVRVREELELLPPYSRAFAELSARYEVSTAVIDDRARRAWRGQGTTDR